MTTVTIDLPEGAFSALRRSPTDRLVDECRPRTKIGRLVLAARKAYIESGGKLLNFDEINAEVRSRRAGLSDE
jgi:hypothetical protein